MSVFNLKRDLIFLDVETTGLDVVKDRILQLAMIKFFKDGREPLEFNEIINPGIPISQEAYNVHGIGPKEVANKAGFKEWAGRIFEFIGDADLAGYNSIRFDFPILEEEFVRYGYELKLNQRKLIDVQRIFYKMEPRTLKAAYSFYCNEVLTDAHDALADIRATVEVLKGQIERYKNVNYIDDKDQVIENPVRNDMDALAEFTNDLKTIDSTQRLKLDEKGNIVFNFGKYANQNLDDVYLREPQYFNWILDKEFSHQVKSIIRQFLESKKKSI